MGQSAWGIPLASDWSRLPIWLIMNGATYQSSSEILLQPLAYWLRSSPNPDPQLPIAMGRSGGKNSLTGIQNGRSAPFHPEWNKWTEPQREESCMHRWLHAICFKRDKCNFNCSVPYLLVHVLTAFGQKRLVSYLAVPYGLSLMKHTACMPAPEEHDRPNALLLRTWSKARAKEIARAWTAICIRLLVRSMI